MNKEVEDLRHEITNLLLKYEVHNEIMALELVRLVVEREKMVSNHVFDEVIKIVQGAENAGS